MVSTSVIFMGGIPFRFDCGSQRIVLEGGHVRGTRAKQLSSNGALRARQQRLGRLVARPYLHPVVAIVVDERPARLLAPVGSGRMVAPAVKQVGGSRRKGHLDVARHLFRLVYA